MMLFHFWITSLVLHSHHMPDNISWRHSLQSEFLSVLFSVVSSVPRTMPHSGWLASKMPTIWKALDNCDWKIEYAEEML